MVSYKKWPKELPLLTPEQQKISDDFMKYWHEVLPKKYGIIDNFNHKWPVKNSSQSFVSTLEIGAGLGEHLNYENLSQEQEKNYYSLELRENMCKKIKENFPNINAIKGDCQKKLNFEDGFFDRILAIHVLEHLPNLPATIKEMWRLCNKEKGEMLIVIPTEGSLAYSLARRISAQRIFEKRYKQSYKWFYSREHINKPNEIIEELLPYFQIVNKSFFPIKVPFIFCNLVIGFKLKPKKKLLY